MGQLLLFALHNKSENKQVPYFQALKTLSGLQTHPLLTFLFSLLLPLDFGLVCKNCAIRRWSFDAVRALDDPPGAFAKLLHVWRVVFFDNRDGERSDFPCHCPSPL